MVIIETIVSIYSPFRKRAQGKMAHYVPICQRMLSSLSLFVLLLCQCVFTPLLITESVVRKNKFVFPGYIGK